MVPRTMPVGHYLDGSVSQAKGSWAGHPAYGSMPWERQWLTGSLQVSHLGERRELLAQGQVGTAASVDHPVDPFFLHTRTPTESLQRRHTGHKWDPRQQPTPGLNRVSRTGQCASAAALASASLSSLRPWGLGVFDLEVPRWLGVLEPRELPSTKRAESVLPKAWGRHRSPWKAVCGPSCLSFSGGEGFGPEESGSPPRHPILARGSAGDRPAPPMQAAIQTA